MKTWPKARYQGQRGLVTVTVDERYVMIDVQQEGASSAWFKITRKTWREVTALAEQYMARVPEWRPAPITHRNGGCMATKEQLLAAVADVRNGMRIVDVEKKHKIYSAYISAACRMLDVPVPLRGPRQPTKPTPEFVALWTNGGTPTLTEKQASESKRRALRFLLVSPAAKQLFAEHLASLVESGR